MKDYNYKKLRNVGLIGHGATGKTSLAEALLFYTNNTDRLGRVEDGSTVMDYEQEEKKRGISLSTSVASFEENNTKINIVDMPGYFDFQGEMYQGMRAVDIATIVICAVSGVQVGTEKAWDYCEKIKLPRAFFINKMDKGALYLKLIFFIHKIYYLFNINSNSVPKLNLNMYIYKK